MMKGQCMPRLKSNSCKNKVPSPMTLLERFREAVLRLMMFSALSKATTTNHGGGERQRRYRHSNSPYDPHHSEAVADCIEFIKKKAATDTIENRRHSNASSSMDDTAEIVVSLSVMSCNP
ncbi:hypothetical protein SESBI_23213 [Sesbania bispinosa]|nr:hypothetical protein SESBI_23213 [Sesbania bispinosa]